MGLHRSLAMTETDAHRLRQKNVKTLRLAIEQSEHEEKEAKKDKARLAKLKREQDMTVHQMKGLIVISNSDDDNDSCTSTSEDQDPPLAADA
ncbi:Phosphorylated carbohydrates phosphatase [Hordeum vulgare]|nr:Phosphorylated carbohydrates phosphatase [Hordeum vulgare]